jgi:hypothetical protein
MPNKVIKIPLENKSFQNKGFSLGLIEAVGLTKGAFAETLFAL